MKSEEVRAAGRLATRTLVDSLSQVEETHRAAAARVFGFAGPAAVPARVVHDGVATGVYTVIRGVGFGVGSAATELLGVTARSPLPAGSTARSNLALAALNATLGDELADQDSPLAIRMAIRSARSDVAGNRDSLKATFPEATPKLVVFIHGLGGTEESWRLHAGRDGEEAESTYGSRLAQDLGYTPAYLRYNTGLHISANGLHLANLLETVVAAWPTQVDELVLIGHSMGGLVARSSVSPGRRTRRPVGEHPAARRLPREPAHGSATRAMGEPPHRNAGQSRREPGASFPSSIGAAQGSRICVAVAWSMMTCLARDRL